MADGAMSDDAREPTEHPHLTAAAIFGVYCLSAAVVGVVLALAVLRVIDVVR